MAEEQPCFLGRDGDPAFLSVRNADKQLQTSAGRETLSTVEIMCISISHSVVADFSKYHYIHHYSEITAVIRPATRLRIIAAFLLTDSHATQLVQA